MNSTMETFINSITNLKGQFDIISNPEMKDVFTGLLGFFMDANSCVHANDPTKQGQVYFNKKNVDDGLFHRCFAIFVHKSVIKIDFPKGLVITNLLGKLFEESGFPLGDERNRAHKITKNLRWTISFDSKQNFSKLLDTNFFDKYFVELQKLENTDKKISVKCKSIR